MPLIFDYFKYAWIDFLKQVEVRHRYYKDAQFSAIDRALLRIYILRNPYRISKNYLIQHNEKDVHAYGETPLTTFEKIAKEVKLLPSDTLLELGCGRGRGAFFLSHFFGCKVIGIEKIPLFIKMAKDTAAKYNVERVSFHCLNMLDMNFPTANVIYLYGTCLARREIKQLILGFKSLPSGTKIVSISYPLTEYTEEGLFHFEKSFSVDFPWGKTDAYVQRIV